MVLPSLVLGMAVLTLGDGPRGPLDQALAAAVAARRERQASIRSIDCSYRLTSVPTKYWIAEMAKGRHVAPEVIETGYVDDGQNPANSKWSTFLVWKVSELAATPFKLTSGSPNRTDPHPGQRSEPAASLIHRPFRHTCQARPGRP